MKYYSVFENVWENNKLFQKPLVDVEQYQYPFSYETKQEAEEKIMELLTANENAEYMVLETYFNGF